MRNPKAPKHNWGMRMAWKKVKKKKNREKNSKNDAYDEETAQ